MEDQMNLCMEAKHKEIKKEGRTERRKLVGREAGSARYPQTRMNHSS